MVIVFIKTTQVVQVAGVLLAWAGGTGRPEPSRHSGRLCNGAGYKIKYAFRTVDDLRQLKPIYFYARTQDSAQGAGVCGEIAIGCVPVTGVVRGPGKAVVVTESARDGANLSQRSIYDERYSAGLYDDRLVPVLTAERDALDSALLRAVTSHPFAQRISLFDFGYGTGRVINDWIEDYARQNLLAAHRELRLVAYDVSSVGLRVAHERLHEAGYEPTGPVNWNSEATRGYIAGRMHKREAGVSVTVLFAHGYESETPHAMRELALAANDGDPYLLTTSLYGSLGHVPGDKLRREYFRQLSELTSPLGEIVLCLSATGDLVEVQPEWAERLARGDTRGFPIEQLGDLVYDTELGQPNFYHVFGTELNDYMKSITIAGQRWWIEGIRYPGEEFESLEAERANYHLVRQANERKRGRVWNADDYREFHSIAAFRGPAGPRNGSRTA